MPGRGIQPTSVLDLDVGVNRYGPAMTSTASTPVTVLGLGPMGRALAAAFLTAGHPTTIWNRTPGSVADLTTRGAIEAPTADAAVAASTLVVLCVRGYSAATEVLSQISGSWAGRTLVNLTSGTPEDARNLAAWMQEHGATYLDGAILTPTISIGTPAGAVLMSGPTSAYSDMAPALAALGGSVLHVSESIDVANSYDVALLDLFTTSVYGLVHALALARAEDLDLATFARLATGIGAMLPEMVTRFAAEVEAGDSPGQRSTIGSAAVSVDHIARTAGDRGLDIGALEAMRTLLTRAVENGYGASGLSRLVLELAASR